MIQETENLQTHWLFVHGLGQTADSWNPTLASFSRSRVCACPDLSELTAGRTADYSNVYSAFCEYCDRFSQPLALCGVSLGAVLCLHYAIERPGRVRMLALIAAQYQTPKALLKFQNVLLRFMPQSMFAQTGFGKKDFMALSKSMTDLDFREGLAGVRCPALVICGQKDRANQKASRNLARLLPNARLYTVANAGHEINVDAPQELASLLDSFEQQLPSQAL